MGTGAGTEGETGGGYLRGSEESETGEKRVSQTARWCVSMTACVRQLHPAPLQLFQSCSSFFYTFRIRKAELNAEFARAFP